MRKERGYQTQSQEIWNKFRKVLPEGKCNKVYVKTKLLGKKLQLHSAHNFSQTFRLQSERHFTPIDFVLQFGSVKRMIQDTHITIQLTRD